MITHTAMIKNRKYAILVISILSALLTPGGDPISMLSMAIPVYILFEISVMVAKITVKKYKQIIIQDV